MIRLEVLGRVALVDSDGASIRSVLAQPARLGLLVYLSLEGGPDGVSRDQLTSLLWPRKDPSKARGSLRQALHFLRKGLGDEVLVSDDDDRLRIAPGTLEVDAVRFRECIAAGDDEGALALYRGDFLIDALPDHLDPLDRWADGVRETLRRDAIDAALRLSDVKNGAVDPPMAVHFALRAHELGPFDDRTARHAADVLEAAGEAGQALTLLEGFSERIETDLEEPPPVWATDRIETLRTRLRATPEGDRSAQRRSEVRDVPRTTPALERPESAAAPGASIWGLALRAAIIVLVVAGAVFGASRMAPGGAEVDDASPDVILVLPFEYRGDGGLAFLGEGAPSLLGAGLAGAADLRIVDTRAVLARGVAVPSDPADLGAFAASFGAGSWITGSILETGGQVRLAASLRRADGRGSALEMEVLRDGPTADALRLVEEIGVEILGARSSSEFGRRTTPVTHSVRAANAFVSGEAAYREGRYLDAAGYYRGAIEADSSFAMAHYRLSLAVTNAGAPGGGQAIQAALARAADLPPLDSALLAAWSLQRSGAILEADRWYRTLVTRRPTDVESWFRLAELQFHWTSVLGIGPAPAYRSFRQVIDLDPGNANAVYHAARGAAHLGDRPAFDSLRSRIRVDGESALWTTELALAAAWWDDDLAATDSLTAPLLTRPVPRVAGTFASLVSSTARLDAAETFLARWQVIEPAEPSVTLWQAQVALGRGRRGAADSLLAHGALPPARAVEMRALFSVLPGLPREPVDLIAIRAELEALPGRALPPRSDPVWRGSLDAPPLAWDGVDARQRALLLGLLAAESGEIERATAEVGALEAMGEGRGPEYARILAARIAFLDGDPAGALAALGPPADPDPPVFEVFTDYGRIYARYLRAEVLDALGRREEALTWFETFPDPQARGLPLIAPALFSRARILEALGRTGEAEGLRAAARSLWADGDPEFRAAAARD